MTLIELLMVIVLIALLAAIALASMRHKRNVYLAVMQADLRNVMTAQEIYHAEHGHYANSTPELGFVPSENVHLLVVGDSLSWAARTQHRIRNDYRCAVFIGPANPIFPPAKQEATIECLPKRKTGQTRR
jgi:Tfp pilus assembly protein PilE